MRDTRTFRNTFQNPLTALLLVAAGMAGGGVVAWTAAQEREREPPMGQALFVGDDVVKPYDPVSSLVGKATDVARPKFPATDIHAHWPASVEPAALLKAMDDLGVERSVNLSGGFGAALDRMLARYHDAAPGRLAIFANINFSTIDSPTFGADHVAMLERPRRFNALRAGFLAEERAPVSA